jgi:hypothetical protein
MGTAHEASEPLTLHAERRVARRNIPPAALEYVLTHGRRIQRTGVTFYFLGRRDVPAADRQVSWVSQLEGTVILMSADGAILTVYRHRKALPTIRRKMKYRRPLPEKDYRNNEFP